MYNLTAYFWGLKVLHTSINSVLGNFHQSKTELFLFKIYILNNVACVIFKKTVLCEEETPECDAKQNCFVYDRTSKRAKNIRPTLRHSLNMNWRRQTSLLFTAIDGVAADPKHRRQSNHRAPMTTTYNKMRQWKLDLLHNRFAWISSSQPERWQHTFPLQQSIHSATLSKSVIMPTQSKDIITKLKSFTLERPIVSTLNSDGAEE